MQAIACPDCGHIFGTNQTETAVCPQCGFAVDVAAVNNGVGNDAEAQTARDEFFTELANSERKLADELARTGLTEAEFCAQYAAAGNIPLTPEFQARVDAERAAADDLADTDAITDEEANGLIEKVEVLSVREFQTAAADAAAAKPANVPTLEA